MISWMIMIMLTPNHQSIGRNEGKAEHSISTASSISPITRIREVHTHPA